MNFGGFCDIIVAKFGTENFGTKEVGWFEVYNKLYFPMKDIYSNNMYFSTASISRANPSYDFEKVLPQKVFKDVLTVAKTTSSIKVKTMTLEELFIKLNKGEK